MFSHQAGFVQFHQLHDSEKIGGLRGDVLPWCSAASRRRLAESMAKIPWSDLKGDVWFVTLTLSPHYWDSPSLVKRGLERFEDRLNYRYESKGYRGGWWKREIGQTRNMHYHLLLVGIADTWKSFANWVQVNWSQAMEYDRIVDRKTQYLRTDVQRPENAVIVSKYLGKYISKAAYQQYDNNTKNNETRLDAGTEPGGRRSTGTDGMEAVADNAPKALSKAHIRGNDNQPLQTSENNTKSWGRHWGIWRRDRLPVAQLAIVADWEFPEKQLWRQSNQLKRAFRKWLEREAVYSEYRRILKQPEWSSHIRVHPERASQLLVALTKERKTDIRRRRKKGEKLPYYETLRCSHGGYTILMSENLKARLLLWSFGEPNLQISINHAN